MVAFALNEFHLRDRKLLKLLVPLAGLEPARCFHHLILSLVDQHFCNWTALAGAAKNLAK
jgi:hypothetical protein